MKERDEKITAIVIDDEPEALTRMEHILDKFPEIEVKGEKSLKQKG